MREIGGGDVLVVVRLDRLARSVSHLLQVIETLEERGAHFRSLRDPIDTSTPQGMFSLQVLGAVAQLERALISERTKAGIKAAKARGKLPGNPGLREHRSDAIRTIAAARNHVYLGDLLTAAPSFLPTVQRMRPRHSWGDVIRVLNHKGQRWTVERLRRSVRRLVRERLAAPELIKRAPRRPPEDRLMTLVAGIAIAGPEHCQSNARRAAAISGPPPPSSICSIARAGWVSSCRNRSTPEVFELDERKLPQAPQPMFGRESSQNRSVEVVSLNPNHAAVQSHEIPLSLMKSESANQLKNQNMQSHEKRSADISRPASASIGGRRPTFGRPLAR